VNAVRLGWEFKFVRFMTISGALLLIVGILILSFVVLLDDQVLPQLLRVILLLASGVALVIFAFRVRNWQGNSTAR
jgi:uncharacterized membrane protein HdeD (DUF308 family)